MTDYGIPGEDSPRVPFITDPEALAADQRPHFDHITESRDVVRGPFGVLLNSPVLAGRVGHLGTYLRFEGALPGDVRELAVLTAAREFDCPYEWAAHVPIARDEGVSDTAIDVVATRGSLEELSEDDAAIVRYARELLVENRVSASTFDHVRDRLGDGGVTELTTLVGYYGMIACVLNAFEVLPLDGPELPRA